MRRRRPWRALWVPGLALPLWLRELPEDFLPSLPISSRVLGVGGWCLVGLGFLGVALTVALGGKPKKKRKMVHVSCTPRHPAKVMRSVYTPPPSRRYQRNVERRR